MAGWRHDYETGTGLKSIQGWNATWARAPAIDVSTRPPVCTTPFCDVLIPTWEESNKVFFAYDVTVYDGPNEIHVRVKDMLGNTTEQVLLVNYSHPANNEPPQLAPGLQATTTYGPSPLWVRFNAGITDADLDDLTYAWTWGDGTTETTTTAFPSHVFYGTGDKLVSVTVTDVHGASVSATLTITPQLPTFISPGSTVYGSTDSIAWSKVDWSDRYDVLLSDTTASTSSIIYTTTNSVLVSTFVVGHSYQVQVRARVSGGYGPWSLARVFNVVPLQSFVPTPLGPVGDVFGTLPTFSWTAVTGADQYEVKVVDPSQGGSLVVLSPMVGNGKLTWTMTQALTLSHTYQWRVHARVGGVFGAWSDLTSFTPHLGPVP